MEGVTLIEDFYGDELAVHLLYENDEAVVRQVQLIAYLSGCPNPVRWKLGFPPCSIVPSRTEWRIIRALRMNARGRISDVASELKLSSRTVKRHLMRLVEGNAFYLDPLLDVRKVGGIRCRFWVVCDPKEKMTIDATVLSKLSRIISTNTATPEHSLYVVHCANASEVKEISQWLSDLSGVKEVRSNIDVEHIHVQEWLAGEIQKRL
jgi:DNA-binding Lrp family transcriptional regulator